MYPQGYGRLPGPPGLFRKDGYHDRPVMITDRTAHDERSYSMSDPNLIFADSGELLEIGPTRIRVLEDGSRTDNRIGAIASILPSGISGPPQHRHLMHDETFLITRGILRFTLGDSHRDAKAGDYVVVPVGAPHTFDNASDSPAEFFSTFTPAYLLRQLFPGSRMSECQGPANSSRTSFVDATICDGAVPF